MSSEVNSSRRVYTLGESQLSYMLLFLIVIGSIVIKRQFGDCSDVLVTNSGSGWNILEPMKSSMILK